jgi:hypothetical protein
MIDQATGNPTFVGAVIDFEDGKYFYRTVKGIRLSKGYNTVNRLKYYYSSKRISRTS